MSWRDPTGVAHETGGSHGAASLMLCEASNVATMWPSNALKEHEGPTTCVRCLAELARLQSQHPRYGRP
jgi:hypothetical protein